MTPIDFNARFGFRQPPFSREIAVEHRFSLPFFDEALLALRRTIDAKTSAALIAPAGTGKTALLRALVAALPEARFRFHYVKVTGLSKRDMCREIANACGAEPAGSYPMLVRRLQERFVSVTATDGVRPVLILDEAHDLRPDVLDMIRIITNFEMDSRLVISVLLAGQPALRELLARDAHEAVTRRLAHIATLRLLSKDESRAYLDHRCTIVGALTLPFDAGAVEAIYEIARGNMRATDQLAYKALEVTHDAGSSVATAANVAMARRVLWP